MGDLVDWKEFQVKYAKFIEAAKYNYHVDNFDTAKELD